MRTNGAQRNAHTDSTGIAIIDSLPPGQYAVTVSMLGMQRVDDSVMIRPGFADSARVILRIDPACF